MRQHAGDEMVAELADAVAIARIVQQILVAGQIPQAPVDVAAVAGLVRHGFWREGGDEAMRVGDVAHRLPEPDLIVSGAQCTGMAQRHLVLSMPKLRIIRVDRDALGREGSHHIVDHIGGFGHGNRTEAQGRSRGVRSRLPRLRGRG